MDSHRNSRNKDHLLNHIDNIILVFVSADFYMFLNSFENNLVERRQIAWKNQIEMSWFSRLILHLRMAIGCMRAK